MVNEIHYISDEDSWPTFRTSLVRLQESPSSSSSSSFSCSSCSFGYTGSSSLVNPTNICRVKMDGPSCRGSGRLHALVNV
ncbi:hypothetical protein E2C01_070340 [Portunus trituberculatus]|uniref:Uncharacterized protein n=1 Tax=Portunus trituberculatus TaxID=210409 RepID=A0A5B7HTX4_PORTR|nr:hypothetical protein [Portunus trituberculatus]